MTTATGRWWADRWWEEKEHTGAVTATRSTGNTWPCSIGSAGPATRAAARNLESWDTSAASTPTVRTAAPTGSLA